MENQASAIESLWERAKNYFETRFELIKLKSIDKASGILAGIISMIVLVCMISLLIIMISIGVSLWIGEALGKSYYGFFIVGAFYGITGLILYAGRKNLIKGPVENKMIKSLLD